MPSTMPEINHHILSTRPLEEALVEEAAKQGIAIDQSDFIATKPILNQETIQSIRSAIDKKAAVVFTSMNAVDAVHAQLADHSPEWNIFSIGHTTQQLIRDYFKTSRMMATGDSAAQLAQAIVDTASFSDVIFFCGDSRRDELPSILRANNIQVNEITVYQTLITSAPIAKVYDGILFFSPSAVESFFTTNTLPTHTIPFAIGKTTAEAIRMHTQNPIIISESPGKDKLARQAIAYFCDQRTN
jgi:uroporphyrinogen-III synthase